MESDRYFVLILMDEPKGTPETFGLKTGGWVAAPAAGRVIDRIAPFLKVERRTDVISADQKAFAEKKIGADEH